MTNDAKIRVCSWHCCQRPAVADGRLCALHVKDDAVRVEKPVKK